jgi:hypothetical protein
VARRQEQREKETPKDVHGQESNILVKIRGYCIKNPTVASQFKNRQAPMAESTTVMVMCHRVVCVC